MAISEMIVPRNRRLPIFLTDIPYSMNLLKLLIGDLRIVFQFSRVLDLNSFLYNLNIFSIQLSLFLLTFVYLSNLV